MQRRAVVLVVGVGLIFAIAWMLWPHDPHHAEMPRARAPGSGINDAQGVDGNAPTLPSPGRHALLNPAAGTHAVKRQDTRAGLAVTNNERERVASNGTAPRPAITDGGTSTPSADEARSQQHFLERRQWRWEDLISQQVAELNAKQQLTQAQQDELFTIMTAANGAIRDALREATQSGKPQAATIQHALDDAYTEADREVRKLLTDAQYEAYQAIRARGGLMGPNPVGAVPPAPAR